MASDWPLVPVDNLKANSASSIAIGPFGSRMKSDCYIPSGIPVIRGTNITGSRSFAGEFVYISEEKADELRSCLVYPGDLVFPHRGAIGEVGIVPTDSVGRYMLSTSLMKLTPDSARCDSLFLFYFFRSQVGRHELLKNASTVGTPGIGQPLTSLKSICVPCPSLDTQKSIAHILGSLDDKTELNRRMNETLEAMAQALFKSWFIDFDPVRAKADGRKPERMDEATAKLFPDSFEVSEFGEIPKGWRVGNFADVAVNPRRGIQAHDIKPSTPYIGLEHMPRQSIALSDWGLSDTIESNKSVFSAGDILFGKLRPYFHKVGVAPLSGVCSTDILVLAPKTPAWFGFMLGHASSIDFVNHTDASVLS